MKDQEQRLSSMTFASVYPLYLAKVKRKERTEEELLKIITWLTGFTREEIEEMILRKSTFQEFFEKAHLHPNAGLIKGVICGIRVEEIKHPLTQKIRYLDKLVDELAKGKSLEKILR